MSNTPEFKMVANALKKPELWQYFDTELDKLTQHERDDLSSRLLKAPREIFEPAQEPDFTRPGGWQVGNTVIYGAVDALLPRPPIEWVVEDLFSPGSVSLLVGDPGSYKTWLGLSMCACVALGKPWIGFEAKKTVSLFVDQESGDDILSRRLGAIIRGELGDNSSPVRYCTMAGLNLLDENDCDRLEQWITGLGAGFVVLDPLAYFMPGADENTVKDTLPVFMALKQIADRTRAAIVALHHNNKGGEYRGSTAMLGAVDLLLKTNRETNSPIIEFSMKKARNVEPFRFAAQFHSEAGQVWFTPLGSRSSGKQLTDEENKVIEYLRSCGGSALKIDIEKNIKDCEVSKVTGAIYSLRDKSMIFRSNKGEGAKDNKAVYSLVTQAGNDDPQPGQEGGYEN